MSTPKDELRRDLSSKCPERFSRNVAANPESLREMGVVGIGGKFMETGDTDEGGLPLLDLLVVGRSLFGSIFACEKAWKIGIRMQSSGSGSAKVDEFCVTHLPSVP